MDTAQEIVIQFHPDGRRFAIYTEEIPLESLGITKTSRASNVERNDVTGEWEVTLTGETTPRFSHKSRRECIRWEIAYIHENMEQIMLQHFPPQDEPTPPAPLRCDCDLNLGNPLHPCPVHGENRLRCTCGQYGKCELHPWLKMRTC